MIDSKSDFVMHLAKQMSDPPTSVGDKSLWKQASELYSIAVMTPQYLAFSQFQNKYAEYKASIEHAAYERAAQVADDFYAAYPAIRISQEIRNLKSQPSSETGGERE